MGDQIVFVLPAGAAEKLIDLHDRLHDQGESWADGCLKVLREQYAAKPTDETRRLFVEWSIGMTLQGKPLPKPVEGVRVAVETYKPHVLGL